jgi:hypothetical protein
LYFGEATLLKIPWPILNLWLPLINIWCASGTNPPVYLKVNPLVIHFAITSE